MELRKNCELIEVSYEKDRKKAVLTFLDKENGQVLEVNFNKQDYKDGEWVESAEKSEKVDKWCEEYFDTTFENLYSAIGAIKDVYNYENFNSLWESEHAQKFTKEQLGEILNATIESVTDDGNRIKITYRDSDTGVVYGSNMTYSKYIEARKEWFVEPTKKTAIFEKFKEKFGVDVENADELKGKEIMVEVKPAFGKFFYGDIKKPKWAK